MKYYAAYGSNLNTVQMYFRCPEATPVGSGTLQDYRLKYRRGFLTVEPEKDQLVQIGIWRISDKDEQRLDRYEGYPSFYRKETVKIYSDDGQELDCLIYIMQDGYPVERPSARYHATVMEGYRDFHLDLKPLADAYHETI